jgi:catalase
MAMARLVPSPSAKTALFYKADTEYGERVAKGLDLNIAEVRRLAGMSQEERVKATAA